MLMKMKKLTETSLKKPASWVQGQCVTNKYPLQPPRQCGVSGLLNRLREQCPSDGGGIPPSGPGEFSRWRTR